MEVIVLQYKLGEGVDMGIKLESRWRFDRAKERLCFGLGWPVYIRLNKNSYSPCLMRAINVSGRAA